MGPAPGLPAVHMTVVRTFGKQTSEPAGDWLPGMEPQGRPSQATEERPLAPIGWIVSLCK